MKKTALVCAIFAACTSNAWAQSNVNLYGLIDVGYGIGNGGIYEGSEGRDSKFQQWGNSRSTSVWGLTGSEDLGNGNKVYFRLEQEFDPESGSDEGGFNRAAYIGLEGRFGSIQAGRQSTISSNIMGEFDVSGAPGLTSSLGNAGVSGDSQRFGDDTYDHANSMLTYISPEFCGFQVQAGVILKNDDAFDLGSRTKNIYSIGALYNYNNLTLGAVFESKPVSGTSGNRISSSWGLGAKYDFGSFLISGSYFDNHLKNDGRGFSLGVAVPVNAFEFGAQVAYNMKAYKGSETHYGWILTPGATNPFDPASYSPFDYEVDKKVKPLAWELYALYNMSKRTQMYVQYGGMDSDAKAFNEASRKYSASLGIIHSF